MYKYCTWSASLWNNDRASILTGHNIDFRSHLCNIVFVSIAMRYATCYLTPHRTHHRWQHPHLWNCLIWLSSHHLWPCLQLNKPNRWTRSIQWWAKLLWTGVSLWLFASLKHNYRLNSKLPELYRNRADIHSRMHRCRNRKGWPWERQKHTPTYRGLPCQEPCTSFECTL